MNLSELRLCRKSHPRHSAAASKGIVFFFFFKKLFLGTSAFVNESDECLEERHPGSGLSPFPRLLCMELKIGSFHPLLAACKLEKKLFLFLLFFSAINRFC